MVKPVLFLLLVNGLSACQDSSEQNRADRFPWQVTVLPDGGSRILGIHLGVTTVREAKQSLGHAPETALFENPDSRLSLELFYKEFNRAGLTARVVLTVGAADAVLQDFRRQSVKKGKLESGVVQYRLDAMALSRMESRPIIAMTYVPYADLKEKTILARFGEPAEKIQTHEQAQHWLYPDKGLDLIINEAGKEILQYVPPKEFARLADPLRRQPVPD